MRPFHQESLLFLSKRSFREFNWCVKDLLLDWNFMFHEFTFFLPLQANAMFLLAWKTVVYLTN